MNDLCNDNRFELIEKYKKELIEATNIETAPDEMAVLDNILFRFWQMGWLDKLEVPPAQPVAKDTNVPTNDCISRQAAIDAFDDYLDEYSGLDEEGYHSEKWCAMSEAKMVIENLPSAQPEPIKINIEDFNKEDWERFKKEWGNMPITVLPAQPEQRWIPVTERLPEEYTRVIGYMAWKAITTIEYQHGRWYSIDHLEPLPDEAVIAWMPLPKPYQEGEQDDNRRV